MTHNFQRTLGKSGIKVSALCMGCWAIGGPMSMCEMPLGWSKVDDAESKRVLGMSGIKTGVITTLMAIVLCLVVCDPCFSQYPESKSQNITKVSNGIFIIDHFESNIMVSEGKDGLLIIDTGYRSKVANLDSVLYSLTKKKVKMLLNTHFHYDHTGGNAYLAKKGAVIVAHKNTREKLLQKWEVPKICGLKWPVIPPRNENFLPKICFEDSLDIHFNNHTIKAIHLPNAHSDCDVVYFFKEVNVIHTGDLFVSNGFPIIDVYYGGNVDGFINALSSIVKLCNNETIVIPGHGIVSNKQGLLDYLQMIIEARKRIEQMMHEKKSLEEIITSYKIDDLLKGKESWIPTKVFVSLVYTGLNGD